MEEVNIIGLDLAKRSFQAHGSRPDGGVAFRKKLSREKVLAFFAERPRCIVAMEACGSAHHWGRVIGELGHEVRSAHLCQAFRCAPKARVTSGGRFHPESCRLIW